MRKKLRITSMAKYLPQKIESKELEKMYNIPVGWAEKHSGVKSRHWVTNETVAYMGAESLKLALSKANLKLNDLDLIISASGSYDYPIPHQAPVIKKQLNNYGTDVPAISIDSTCLSFVTALDIASYLLDGERYNRIAIISSEISSKNLNPKNYETFTLFGDGASCAIVEYCPSAESEILSAHMITKEEGAEETIVKAGGIKYHPKDYPFTPEKYSFQMNGRNLLRLAKKYIKPFIQSLIDKSGIPIESINYFVPHQGSKMGLFLFEKIYPEFRNKIANNLSTHGNCIAASIPMAFHDAIENGKIKRGDIIVLAGTSAGFSIGGLILKF